MASNIGTHIQAVGAAWLMTSLDPSPDMVALVYSSTALPVLVFALLSGAVADIFDRRVLMLVAQGLALTASVVMAVLAYSDVITPWTLLALTFLLGCATALHGPSWQASVGEQVPREDLPSAVALNSMGFNAARAVGPAVGGAIVAAAGSSATFLVNAFSYLGLIVVLARWRPQQTRHTLPREPLWSAMGAGLRYARMAPLVRTVLARALVFGLAGSSIWALMPLVAREVLRKGPGTYGLLLGALGVGAVFGAFSSTAIRRRVSVEGLVRGCAGAFAVGSMIVAASTSLPLTLASLLVVGGAWVLTLSSLNASVQMAAPRWVVGRAMSLFQMCIFGGMAAGAWAWGQLADATTLRTALAVSGVAMLGTILIGVRRRLPDLENLDLSPLRGEFNPNIPFEPDPRSGPVVITIEYRVRLEHAGEFTAAMREKRRIRQRDGAQRWTLLHDLSDPEAWIERFQTPSWTEHLRQRKRVTLADRDIEARVRAFHCGDQPPRVRRFLENRSAATPSTPVELSSPFI